MAKKTYYIVHIGRAMPLDEAEKYAKENAPAVLAHRYDNQYGVTTLSETLQDLGQVKYTGPRHMLYRKKPAPKVKPIPLPAEIWVMGYHTFNQLGSICHVSHGDLFYAAEAECQRAIDTMKGWIGMGSRSQYRPVMLVSKKE